MVDKKIDMSFAEKLMHIQVELKAPKDKTNKFGGYNYRSAEGILESLKPLLKTYGVYVTLNDDIVEIGGRFYVKATATIKDIGSSEFTYTSAMAREAEIKKGMDDSQITGSASSYARKYALNGLFLLDDTKDADSDEYQQATSKPQSAPKKAKQTEDKKTSELICDRCKKPIPAHGNATPEQVAKFTEKECGKRLCYDCGKIVKEAQTAPIEEFVTDEDINLPFPIE